MNLTQRCAAADEQLVGLIARKVAIEEQLTSQRLRMEALVERKAHLVKCIDTLDAVIQTISAKGIGRIEATVTAGLQLVFGESVSCILEKNEGKRGTTYTIKVKQGDVIDDPLDAFGGGIVNLVAFLLRVLLLHRFKLAKLLLLDESFNNVSPTGGYLDRTSLLVRSLAEDYGFTIVAVTHQPEMAAQAHRAYEVSGEGPFEVRALGVGELA